MTDFYKREDISKDTIEFTITVPKDEYQKEYSMLLKKELENTDIKGFRKGKAPKDFVEPQVGSTLKIRAFENLVPMLLTTALQKENLEPIAPPEYKEFPKFEEGKDISFSMNITVMPDFQIGDVKKIKIEKEEIEVSEKEINDALEGLKKNQKTKATEINEDWAKEIIEILKLDDVKDLEGIKGHIKGLIKHQKEHMQQHKMEDDILAQGIKISNIEIPAPAIKYEAEERERAFINDMQQKGINTEDFLKANNITIEKMRELWEKDAQQALETDVFLRMYIKERGLKITDEELESKVEEIKKGAPEGVDKKIFEDEQWREYIRRVEEKEKAFHSLIDEVSGK